jgi:hypothetical protein
VTEHRRLELVHDVLDAQLLDERDERIGRVDDLVLEWRDDGRIRLTDILIGGPARAQRLGAWARAISRVLNHGRRIEQRVSKVPFGGVRRIADTVCLDIDGEKLPSSHVETWLRDHIVCHIPGSGGTQK